MNRPTQDLFDDKTMSFGEHLEELRWHLVRSIIYLVVAFILCLFWGGYIFDFVRSPIDKALAQYSKAELKDDTQAFRNWSDRLYTDWGLDVWFGERESAVEAEQPVAADPAEAIDEVLPQGSLRVQLNVEDLLHELQQARPDLIPAVPPAGADAASSGVAGATHQKAGEKISLVLSSPVFAEMQAVIEQSRRAVTLKAEEAFTTYLQVAAISAFVLASPLIFRELWLFIAAGLYPHERQYVHIYGTLSLVLFLSGAIFCFYAVFPFVLKFLLSFNSYLQIQPQIRLSEWINFAIMLPVAFGISFQLPLVMLFLERLQILELSTYTQNRKLAILTISILSTLFTPPDPMSMVMMMLPLILLYELGILLCRWAPQRSPFEGGGRTAPAGKPA